MIVLQKNRNGFTLVELLAVIVILGIIMIIAIPAVINTMNLARKKTFEEFIDKSVSVAQKKQMEDSLKGINTGGCIIYDIAKDLDIPTVGDFEGYVLINSNSNDVYVTLHDKEFMITGYKYGDNIEENDLLKSYIENNDELKVEYLCEQSSDCTYCLVKKINEDGSRSDDFAISEETRKGTLLADGNTVNGIIKSAITGTTQTSNYQDNTVVKHIKYTNDIKDTTYKISLDSSPNPAYVWLEGDTLYIGSKEDKITFNENSKNAFAALSAAETIDMSHFDFSKVKIANTMFGWMHKLKSIDLSGFKGAKLEEAYAMFAFDQEITNIDVSSLDVSRVQDFTGFFCGMTKLKTLDLSNWNTGRANNMMSMFEKCYSLTSIKFGPNFKTNNVTSMSGMFYVCSSLTSLDLSGFDTSSVTDMSAMLRECTSLTSLDLSNFNVSSLDYMGYMFWGSDKIATLDLSNWHLKSGVDGQSMFNYMSELRTIYVSESWKNKVVTAKNDGFFYDDKKLVGGNGTKFTDIYDHTKNRAIIDGEGGQKGYFTKK